MSTLQLPFLKFIAFNFYEKGEENKKRKRGFCKIKYILFLFQIYFNEATRKNMKFLEIQKAIHRKHQKKETFFIFFEKISRSSKIYYYY